MRIIKLFRPVNLVIIAIVQYVIQYHIILPYAGDSMITFSHVQFLLMVLITMSVAAGGYVINDYYDIAIDLINKPGKDLFSTGISKNVALKLYGAIVATGFILTSLLGDPYRWPGLGVYTGSVFLMWAYSARLKLTPLAGNILVSVFSAFVVFILWIAQAVNGVVYEEHTSYAASIIWMYSGFAFMTTLIREIVKDMEDIGGDSAYGAKTLPVIIGMRTTKLLTVLLTIFLVINLAVWVIYMHEKAQFNVLAMFTAMVIIPLAALIPAIATAQGQQAYHRISQLIKAIILVATAFLLAL